MPFNELLDALKDLYGDVELNTPLSNGWLVDLYVPKHRIAVLALKGRRGEASVNRFYASLLKLADMKRFDEGLKPVILWSGPLPLTPLDLEVASRWGVYVVSSKQLALLKEVEAGESPEAVNGKAKSSLVKPLQTPKIGRQQVKLVEAELLNELSKEPLSLPEVIDKLKGKAPSRSVYWAFRKLHAQGKILTLVRSNKRVTIYGTSQSQLPLALMKAPSKEQLQAKRLNEIHRLIARKGALTAREIADALGYPERVVVADLVRLKDKGLVKRVKLNRKTTKWVATS